MEILETKSLLNKRKSEVAAIIKANCAHSDYQQLRVLLESLLSPLNDIDDEEVIDWLSWLISGGLTPEEFSSTVRMYDKATTCGLVWSENFVAYRCRTCGISPCMSLCTECFHHGNHEGHDFIVFRSETGGACDCGETNIIKESGCCSLHGPQGPQAPAHSTRNRTDSSSEQSAPAELLTIANEMMPKLFQKLILAMRDEHKQRLKSPATIATSVCKHSMNEGGASSDLMKGHKFIKLLQNLSDMGIAMRQVMIHTLTKTHAYVGVMGMERNTPSFKTFLEELVYWTAKFEFPEGLICLLLSLRSDASYKKDFTKAFIFHYKLISEAILRSVDPEKLCKHVAAVSVQLFSIEKLAVEMVEETELLHLLLTSLHSMIDNAVPGEEGNKKHNRMHTVDCENDIMKNNYYWPVKSDLKELLSHKSVALKFLENESLVKTWFELLTHLQGMNSIKYIEKGQPHVEVETESHIGAFTAELEISATPMWTILSHLTDATTIPLTKAAIKNCTEALLQWAAEAPIACRARGNVSFHLPLHRNLSMLIRQGHQQQGIPLEELVPAKEHLGTIARHLIRLQSAFYQILGRLWARNGTEALNQAESFVNSLCCNSMIDADIFFLQVLSEFMAKEEFLRIVFEEFFVHDCVDHVANSVISNNNNHEPSNLDAEEKSVMLESTLLFLATLAAFRGNLGLSDEEVMALEMSTLLCKSDKLHSELMEQLPERCGTDSQLKNFEQVLGLVSDYQAPRNMLQGKYVPKDIVWTNYYDPLHTLLRSSNRGEFQMSMDRLMEFVRRASRESSSSGLWPPFKLPKQTRLCPSSINPCKFLQTELFLEVVFFVLLKAVHFNNVPTLTMALIIYLLEISVVEQDGVEVDDFLNKITKNISLSQLADVIGVNPTREESILTLLIQVHLHLKGSSSALSMTDQELANSRIGDGYALTSNLLRKLGQQRTDIQELISVHKNQLDIYQEERCEREREDRRRKAKERKLQLLSEMALKGQKFMKEMDALEMSSSKMQPEGNGDPTETEFQCVICMEKGGSRYGNPYGLITYLAPTPVLGHRKIKESVGNTELASFSSYWKSVHEQFSNKFDETSLRLSFPVACGNAVAIHSCGHYFHTDCFDSYISSLKNTQCFFHQRDVIQLTYKKFSCPMCRQTGNSFLPVIRDALERKTMDATEAIDEELSRLYKKRSTLVLSPKQKQSTEKFLQDLHKVVSYTYRGTEEEKSSCNSITTSAQTLSLIFLNTISLEALKRSGEVNKQFLLPFYSVLRYAYKSLSVSHSRRISQYWDSVSGSKMLGKVKREVPTLLKDVSLQLSHLMLELPYNNEKKYVNLVIHKLYTLRIVQILCALCYQLDEEGLKRVKADIGSLSSTRIHTLHVIVLSIIDNLLNINRSYNAYSWVKMSPLTISSLILNSSELESFIARKMHSFCKVVVQLSSCFKEQSSPCSSGHLDIITNISQTISEGQIFLTSSMLERSLNVWISELNNAEEVSQKMFLTHLITWDEPRLIELPNEYDKIFQTYRQMQCENCKMTPSEPALCLMCQKIVCLNSFCCLDKLSKVSEVIHHSLECGIGTGVFLCVLSSAILVVSGKDACVWGSIFLDSFGEEDLDLKRGKPLYLCKDRLQCLEKQWKLQNFHRYELKWFPHDNML